MHGVHGELRGAPCASTVRRRSTGMGGRRARVGGSPRGATFWSDVIWSVPIRLLRTFARVGSFCSAAPSSGNLERRCVNLPRHTREAAACMSGGGRCEWAASTECTGIGASWRGGLSGADQPTISMRSPQLATAVALAGEEKMCIESTWGACHAPPVRGCTFAHAGARGCTFTHAGARGGGCRARAPPPAAPPRTRRTP